LSSERIAAQPLTINSIRLAIILGRHGGCSARPGIFWMILMVLMRFGDFLYWVGWVISGILLFDFPATIFAYSAFAARLTNVYDTILLGSSCMTIGCLSWLAGRAMGYILARI